MSLLPDADDPSAAREVSGAYCVALAAFPDGTFEQLPGTFDAEDEMA